MQIIISGRNVDVADGLRTHIEDRFGRLSRFESRASRVEVTLARGEEPQHRRSSYERGRSRDNVREGGRPGSQDCSRPPVR